MGIVAFIILVATLSAATYWDLREGRIPNRLTFAALALGLLIAAASARFATAADPLLGSLPLSGLSPSLLGIAASGLLPLMLYMSGSGGAGDVKLAWAVGSLLGWRDGALTVLVAYLAAGCFALIWLTIRGRFGTLLLVAVRRAGHRLLPSRVGAPPAAQSALVDRKLAMSPFFACGAALVLAEGRLL
jgi:Flp pilus assembly protein protease CpaA